MASISSRFTRTLRFWGVWTFFISALRLFSRRPGSSSLLDDCWLSFSHFFSSRWYWWWYLSWKRQSKDSTQFTFFFLSLLVESTCFSAVNDWADTSKSSSSMPRNSFISLERVFGVDIQQRSEESRRNFLLARLSSFLQIHHRIVLSVDRGVSRWIWSERKKKPIWTLLMICKELRCCGEEEYIYWKLSIELALSLAFCLRRFSPSKTFGDSTQHNRETRDLFDETFNITHRFY